MSPSEDDQPIRTAADLLFGQILVQWAERRRDELREQGHPAFALDYDQTARKLRGELERRYRW